MESLMMAVNLKIALHLAKYTNDSLGIPQGEI
jgi:hypothetical protein